MPPFERPLVPSIKKRPLYYHWIEIQDRFCLVWGEANIDLFVCYCPCILWTENINFVTTVICAMFRIKYPRYWYFCRLLSLYSMSRKYKFRANSTLYFVSFAVINWIDVFIRNEYKQVILDSLEYCQKFKELELYAWCLMTSHVHLIIGSRGNPMHNIIRDMKSHTSTNWGQLLAGMHRKAGRSACPDFSGDVMDDGQGREEEF